VADDTSKSPVTVDIGASAKLEVKTEIPPESSGRLLDALTDIIRPFSESRGLRADQIRLQREDVLIQIAEKAKKRLALESLEPSAVPNKFLIPFLEKASYEDVDSEMVDMWSALLASASTEYDETYTSYISILSELGPVAAGYLRKLVLEVGDFQTIQTCQDTPTSEWKQAIRDWVSDKVMSTSGIFYPLEKADVDVGQVIVEKFDFKMSRLKEVEVVINSTLGPKSHTIFRPAGTGKYTAAASILMRLGLLTEQLIEYEDGHGSQVLVSVVAPTYLGIELVLRCERFKDNVQ